jgi:hypothetical protein
MIIIIAVIGLLLFGGFGYFIYCDIALQKTQKADIETKNKKK